MTREMRPAPREWLLLLVLSGIQFSQMVDFMVLMPLGTQLMRAFNITATQLGFFVSIYAVAASLSGFFSALVIDRFDRKTAMLALYACFAATMAACALAPSYATLLAARTAAGAFGGVVAANIFRSEEHTSELQSRPHLVCRLLLEKKKNDTCSWN